MRRPERRRWREALAEALAEAAPFAGCVLRDGRREDEPQLFALHREAMREYVIQTWGWDEHWQRVHFRKAYVPANHAIIVRRESQAPRGDEPLVGRVCLTRHWRRIFLRDIELAAGARNRGLGTAIMRAVLELAHREHRAVDLLVLKCNPAQRLYARLGFGVTADDGARVTMRWEGTTRPA
jgi:ribosomal protein S18 acetylase RimI-like enzyme